MDEVIEDEAMRTTRWSLHRVLAGVAGIALIGSLAGSAALAAGASAATNSNTVSRAAPPDGQPPTVAGEVQSVDASAGTFTIDTSTGTTYIVDVSTSTSYGDPSIPSPTLADVKVGEHVAVFGTTSSNTVTATRVLIGGAAPTVSGTVKSVDSTDDSFTIDTSTGTTYTVDVSTSTSYGDPSVSSPTLADVKVGEHVAVFGTTSSNTVTASRVLIGNAGGACMGGMEGRGGPPDGTRGAAYLGGNLPSGAPAQG